MQAVVDFIGGSLVFFFGVAVISGITILIGTSVMNRIPRLRNVRFANAYWRSATPARLRWFGGSFGRGIYLRSKNGRPGTMSNLGALAGTLFLILSALFVGISVMGWALSVETDGEVGPFIGIGVFFGGAFACGYTVLKLTRFFRLLAHKRRQLIATSVSEALAADARPPILLLRSFRDDGREVGLLDDDALPATLEDALVDRLSRRGPVISVGRPNESLPPLGASREYVTGDWQQRVRQLISEAAIVVAILDRTPGLLWEIEQIFTLDRQDRLIIVAPDEGLFELSRRWRAIVGTVSTNRSELTDGRMRLSMRKTMAIVFEASGHVRRIVCRNRFRGSYRDAIELGFWFVTCQKAKSHTESSIK